MKAIKWVFSFIILIGLLFGMIRYYPFIFARTVIGVVVDVQKIEMEETILSRPTRTTPNKGDLPYMHSFAIAIKDKSNEIITSSSEDRQWAVVKAGHCVEAKYFPYPPWNFDKSGTYFGARLLKLSECDPNSTTVTQ